MKYLMFIASTFLLVSCSLMQNRCIIMHQYEDAVYRYITVQDEKSEERLLKNYEKILGKPGIRKHRLQVYVPTMVIFY